MLLFVTQSPVPKGWGEKEYGVLITRGKSCLLSFNWSPLLSKGQRSPAVLTRNVLVLGTLWFATWALGKVNWNS